MAIERVLDAVLRSASPWQTAVVVLVIAVAGGLLYALREHFRCKTNVDTAESLAGGGIVYRKRGRSTFLVVRPIRDVDDPRLSGRAVLDDTAARAAPQAASLPSPPAPTGEESVSDAIREDLSKYVLGHKLEIEKMARAAGHRYRLPSGEVDELVGSLYVVLAKNWARDLFLATASARIGYVYRTLDNLAKAAQAKAVRERSRREPAGTGVPDVADPQDAQQAADRDADEQLLNAIRDALTEEEQAVVSMMYLNGLPHKDIAEALNMTPSTVSRRFRSSAKKIQAALDVQPADKVEEKKES